MTQFLAQTRQWFIIYLFALAILMGSAYTMYRHFDFSHSTDAKSYMQMAEGNFEVTATHRYRVIVPFMAAAVTWPVTKVYRTIWPTRKNDLTPLHLGFYVVNLLLTALMGFFIFRACLLYGVNLGSALLALVAMLTSRWAIYTAGLPLTDSLYWLICALAFYGIKANAKWAIIVSILIGPHAKEAFIFFAPIIVFYGKAVPKKYQVGLFLLSGLLVFGLRYYIDSLWAIPPEQSMANAFDHVNNIILSLKRMFSPKGMGEIWSVFGLFTLVLLIGLTAGKTGRNSWLPKLDRVCLWWLIAVLVQVLLSSDVGRMLYLTAPVFAVATGLIFDGHPFFIRFKAAFYHSGTGRA